MLDEIRETLKLNGFELGEEYIARSLADGLFVLLLDGFDEVQFSQRKVIEREIRKLALSTNCQIVITSRADASLQSWDHFTNVKISNLELDEACELVGRARFDSDIKARFIHSLRGGLFKSHEFFLSNPLLLSIMLLTYGDSADIPKRQSSFYMQAYEALFQQHDALKGSFKRERKTDLDIYEFARLFSGFSIVSYDERAFRFGYTEALKFVKKGAEITGVARASAEAFLEDAKQAVCLLLEDGLELAFAHRSFQEYFAARFIAESGEALQRKVIEKITSKKSSPVQLDNVIGLLHEMDPMLVERYFLIPKLSAFFGTADKRKVSRAFWFSAFQRAFDAIRMDKDDGRIWFHMGEKNIPTYDLISFVQDKYLREECGFDEVVWRERSHLFCEKYFGGMSFQLDIKTVSQSSELARDLAELNVLWSVSGLERVRCCLRDMRERAASRAIALEKIFT